MAPIPCGQANWWATSTHPDAARRPLPYLLVLAECGARNADGAQAPEVRLSREVDGQTALCVACFSLKPFHSPDGAQDLLGLTIAADRVHFYDLDELNLPYFDSSAWHVSLRGESREFMAYLVDHSPHNHGQQLGCLSSQVCRSSALDQARLCTTSTSDGRPGAQDGRFSMHWSWAENTPPLHPRRLDGLSVQGSAAFPSNDPDGSGSVRFARRPSAASKLNMSQIVLATPTVATKVLTESEIGCGGPVRSSTVVLGNPQLPHFSVPRHAGESAEDHEERRQRVAASLQKYKTITCRSNGIKKGNVDRGQATRQLVAGRQAALKAATNRPQKSPRGTLDARQGPALADCAQIPLPSSEAFELMQELEERGFDDFEESCFDDPNIGALLNRLD